MKAVAIILLALILFAAITGIIEYKDEKLSINHNGFPEKITKTYDQISENITIAYDNFMAKNFEPPDYQFQITDAVNLKDCVLYSYESKESCLLVNLDLKNDEDDSISFQITERTIVTQDGRQLDKYGGLYNTRELNGLCDTPNFFKLFPNASKKVGICFPVVRKDEKPVMYIGITANGKQKQHTFDLASFIS